MSNRRNPALDHAEENRAELKALAKKKSNKEECADCHKNSNPRWASWNLGIFICIRCSGIHRGMGTHISRVKSVDLDTWTDEQLQVMKNWGNYRANEYWEHKLADGHKPSESKLENFIRTKYESKRWVMEGGMPDPAIFGTSPKDDEDQDGRGVGQKAKVERAASAGKVAAGPAIRAPARLAANIDLIGGVDAPQRPSTTEPVSRQPPSKAPAAPPKQTKPADSLLGLDFFGGTQSAPPERPASVTTNSSSSVPSRPDLKQSILSLYASAPRAAAPPQQPQHQRGSSSGDFQGFQSPPLQSPTQMNQGAAGGLNDAFSSLSFASTSSPPTQQTKPSPFANLASSATSRRQPSTASASSFGGGGSFFDAPSQKPMPTSPPAQPSAPQRGFSQSSGFGDFFSATSPIATQPPPKPTNPMSGGGGDLFDLAMPSQPAAPAPKPISPTMNAFNLSAPTQPQQPLAPKPQAAPAPMANFSSDPWGSNDVWGSSNNEAPVPAPAPKAPMPSNGISNDFGWGSSAAAKPTSPPKITQDDDFGGWSSAPAPAQQQQPPPPKPSGGGFSSNNDDLFSNVWE